jgi:ubiquinol-cytochrome c reductase iron-sulfur subunit
VRRGPFRWLVAALLWLVGRSPKRRAEDRDGEPGRAGEPPEHVELELGPRRRAESLVLVLLLLTIPASGAFIFFFVVLPNTQLLGLSMGVALALLAAAAIIAGKRVIPQEVAVEDRTVDPVPEETRDEVVEIVHQGVAGVSRRKLLAGAAGAAGASVAAAAAFPVASFGPSVGDKIYRTAWQRGRRVVDEEDLPIKAEDLSEGGFLTGFPEGASKSELGASLIIVKLDPEALEMPDERVSGAPEGILAFSKICTHAGCAVSMLQNPLYPPTSPPNALVCPCHYSTFDPALGGKVIFGPAARDLPQLPLAIAPDRTLMAAGDYFDPIGPSYGGIRLRGE